MVEKPTPQDARWADVIRGDTNDADYVDVAKVQQLAFTVLLIVVYGAALFAALAAVGAGGVPKELTEFPAVDGGFVSPGAQPRRLPGLESGPEAVARGRRPSRPAPPPSSRFAHGGVTARREDERNRGPAPADPAYDTLEFARRRP